MQDTRVNQYSVLNKARQFRVLVVYLDPVLDLVLQLHDQRHEGRVNEIII
jgi:hypothetical protein